MLLSIIMLSIVLIYSPRWDLVAVQGYRWLRACLTLLRLRAIVKRAFIYLVVGNYIGRIGIYLYVGLAV